MNFNTWLGMQTGMQVYDYRALCTGDEEFKKAEIELNEVFDEWIEQKNPSAEMIAVAEQQLNEWDFERTITQ